MSQDKFGTEAKKFELYVGDRASQISDERLSSGERLHVANVGGDVGVVIRVNVAVDIGVLVCIK